MSRAVSREEAFKLIFEYCMNGEANELTLNEVLSVPQVEEDYVKKVYYGVIEHIEELKQEIANVTKTFSLDRIFKVDLALLLLSLYEIKYMPEIPHAVSINEVLNLAKVYSTEKSSAYINGVLANFAGNKNE